MLCKKKQNNNWIVINAVSGYYINFRKINLVTNETERILTCFGFKCAFEMIWPI